MDIIAKLTEEFKLKYDQVEKTVALIDEGNTIPFIARYRKEVTGSLDDVVLRDLNDRLSYLRNLDKRREEVRNSITEQGKMTDEINEAIENASILTELEDIYRPFKPHRKTRASVAREKGLEGLANYIMEQRASYETSIEEEAEKYISDVEGKEVKMSVKVGDRVIVSKYAGTEIKCDGREYNIVRNDDILAIVE
jgi:uncharacterized protein